MGVTAMGVTDMGVTVIGVTDMGVTDTILGVTHRAVLCDSMVAVHELILRDVKSLGGCKQPGEVDLVLCLAHDEELLVLGRGNKPLEIEAH